MQLEQAEGVVDSSAVLRSALSAAGEREHGGGAGGAAGAPDAGVVSRASRREQQRILPFLVSVRVRRGRRLDARARRTCAVRRPGRMVLKADSGRDVRGCEEGWGGVGGGGSDQTLTTSQTG